MGNVVIMEAMGGTAGAARSMHSTQPMLLLVARYNLQNLRACTGAESFTSPFAVPPERESPFHRASLRFESSAPSTSFKPLMEL